jgi:hypothetical protein
LRTRWRRSPGRSPGVRTATAMIFLPTSIAATRSYTISTVSGHASVGLQTEVALPVDVAHLVAMAVLLGGLTVLTLTLRQTPTEPDHRQDLGTAVARFSQIALGCVVVLTCTGAYQAWRQLGAWTAFLGTDGRDSADGDRRGHQAVRARGSRCRPTAARGDCSRSSATAQAPSSP